MASFAKLGINGKVLEVRSISNDVIKDTDGTEKENIGIDFLENLTSWPCWVQCSYNTSEGVHLLGGTPFRKNFPGIDYKYDEDRDAFIPKKSFNSWVLNEETCRWEAPIPLPDTENKYNWNEETQQWNLINE